MANQKQKTKEAFKHDKSDLINNAASFGVKPEVMAGALYGVDKASKEEATKLINTFLRKEVK